MRTFGAATFNSLRFESRQKSNKVSFLVVSVFSTKSNARNKLLLPALLGPMITFIPSLKEISLSLKFL